MKIKKQKKCAICGERLSHSRCINPKCKEYRVAMKIRIIDSGVVAEAITYRQKQKAKKMVDLGIADYENGKCAICGERLSHRYRCINPECKEYNPSFLKEDIRNSHIKGIENLERMVA